jgi:predicted DNA-binding transcriptional regulator YafY
MGPSGWICCTLHLRQVGAQVSDGGRNAQLVRLVSLIRDLDRLGGVDIYELADRHGVGRRTILRDLRALEDAGIPLVEERDGKRKRHRLGIKSQARQVAALLDSGHYLGLRVALGQGGAAVNNSTAFAQLEDLAAKVEQALGPAERRRLESIEACFHSREGFAWKTAPPDVLWPLVDAITGRLLCSVRYSATGTGRGRTYEILPLRVFAHDGATYIYAWHPKREKVLTLNLHRLHQLRVLPTVVVPPAGFDPAALDVEGFGVMRGGEVESWDLVFTPEVSRFIRERQWHPQQTLEDTPGGGVRLRFTCEGGVQVFAWAASWHREVEVLAPERARRQLAALGTWLSDRYAAAE